MAATRSIHLNPTGSSYKAITCLKPFFSLINGSAYGRLQVWKELIRPLQEYGLKKIDRFNLLFHVFRLDGNGNSIIEVFVCCYQTAIESEKQLRCYCRCYEDK